MTLTMTRGFATCEVIEIGEYWMCGEEVSAKGMCSKHYQRLRKFGDPTITSEAEWRRRNAS